MHTGRYYLHPLFELTVEDIFNKFDMLMNRVLGYREFKGFCQCIGKDLDYNEFINDYLENFQSTDKGGLGGEEGLTMNGFKDFF